MATYDPFIKALKLVQEGRVVRLAGAFFKVFGETDDYDVFFNHSQVSCTCRHYSLHGCRVTKIKENGDREGYTKGAICCHIMAVILQQGLLWWKNEKIQLKTIKGEKKIPYKGTSGPSL